MIRGAAAGISLIVLIASLGFAQEAPPKIQVFGGYSFVYEKNAGLSGTALDVALRQNAGVFGVQNNFNGWSAEAQYNVDRWLGVVADFGGHYGSPMNRVHGSTATGLPKDTTYTFMVGPVISYRTKSRLTPFGHGLFGWDRNSLDASMITGVPVPVATAASTSTDFVMAGGGGLDFKLSRRFAVRLAQVDYFRTSLNLNSFYGRAFGSGLLPGLATHQDSLRISAGAVVRF
jgi:opacity protein-like surface antigen